MKKVATSILTLFLSLGLLAQTGPGSILIEGGTDFSWQSQETLEIKESAGGIDLTIGEDALEDVAINTTEATLKLGVFGINNVAIGGFVNYTSTEIDYADDELYIDNSASQAVYGGFMRYYIGGIAFIGGAYGMLSSSAWDDLDDKPSVSYAIGEVGVSLFLTPNIAFTPKAMYTYQIAKDYYYDYDYGTVTETITKGILKVSAGITIHI